MFMKKRCLTNKIYHSNESPLCRFFCVVENYNDKRSKATRPGYRLRLTGEEVFWLGKKT